MAKYKFVLYYPDGTEFDSTEDDLLYDDEQSAADMALYYISCYKTGGEILHLSNPGDYDEVSSDDVDYEVFEVDD